MSRKRINTVIPDAVFAPGRVNWSSGNTHKPILWVNGRMRVLPLRLSFYEMARANATTYAAAAVTDPKSPLFGYKVQCFRANERARYMSGWVP